MGKRLNIVTEYTDNIDQFQQALVHVGDAAAKRMPDAVPDIRPSGRRTISGPNSVFSPALKLKPSISIDLPPALQDALRHANISVNHNSIESLLDVLNKTQLERDTRLREHYDSSSSSAHSTLAARCSTADVDLRSILKPLYSHTPFQQVSLTNPKLEDELKRMEEELETANDLLLTAETNELSLSDARVRAFIAKYGK
jgi:hypothetical protein